MIQVSFVFRYTSTRLLLDEHGSSIKMSIISSSDDYLIITSLRSKHDKISYLCKKIKGQRQIDIYFTK